jgi:hypothetical protein
MASAKGATNKRMGRPPTVQGGGQLTIMLSPALYEELERLRVQHQLTKSQLVRFAVAMLVDSPGDLVRAMREDPQAIRTVAERRRTKSRSGRAVLAR